jgi:hypothetical protein
VRSLASNVGSDQRDLNSPDSDHPVWSRAGFERRDLQASVVDAGFRQFVRSSQPILSSSARDIVLATVPRGQALKLYD